MAYRIQDAVALLEDLPARISMTGEHARTIGDVIAYTKSLQNASRMNLIAFALAGSASNQSNELLVARRAVNIADEVLNQLNQEKAE